MRFYFGNKMRMKSSVLRMVSASLAITTLLFVIGLNEMKNENQRHLSQIPPNSCQPIYGKVHVFVAVTSDQYDLQYRIAQASLHCYLMIQKYHYRLAFVDKEPAIMEKCPQEQVFYRKHCAAALYLEESDADWLLVLDADTGVVNPNHCIEEYIDDSVDLIFYERFFNWEIASGNYLVKNTEFGRNFLYKWASYEQLQPAPPTFTGLDNGALQIHILRTVLPESQEEIESCTAIWERARDYDSYMRYVSCVRVTLGARKHWPHIKLLHRAHGWVMDWWLTYDKWCSFNFMFHGWKHNHIGADDRSFGKWRSPFYELFDPETTCSNATGWPWRTELMVSCNEVKANLQVAEREYVKIYPSIANTLPWLSQSDAVCWPTCNERK